MSVPGPAEDAATTLAPMFVRAILRPERAARVVVVLGILASVLLGIGAADVSATVRTVATTKAKPRIQVFKVGSGAYRGMVITPALSTGPSRMARVRGPGSKWTTKTVPSKQEWVVVTGAMNADLLSVSTTGKVRLLTSGLLPPAAVPSGQVSGLPSYGSVQADGHVWLLDYSLDPAPLYAVGPSGRPVRVAWLKGDFTALTAGPRNTLEAADNSGSIVRCSITKHPAARCASATVPARFDGGQVAALGQAGGRVWFTDDSGELGSFNPSGNRFAGPFGNLRVNGQSAGQGSADAGTITADLKGWLYMAGGQASDPLLENDQIRMINPHNGRLTHIYSRGLTDVLGLAPGADGNIWFLNQTNAQTGAGKVGVLNTTNGRISQYALPRGYRLPRSGAAIGAGPSASNTLFFTLQSDSDARAAVGVVSLPQ